MPHTLRHTPLAKYYLRLLPDELPELRKEPELLEPLELPELRNEPELERDDELDATEDVPLSCITFGDIAFAAFPYEMFHENGRQTREGSPYKMTFVNSLAGGSFGYIPTKEAFPHGSYEVVTCKYTEGCGEQFVADMLTLLNQCKNAG